MSEPTMNEAIFWEIIESFEKPKDGVNVTVMEPAINKLSQMTIPDLEQFSEILTQKLFLLDTRAHGEACGFGVEYFSVDRFLYIRCAVVANGKLNFETILHAPQLMEHFKDFDFESLLYMAHDAYEAMGFDDDWDYYPKLSYETFSNEDGWKDANFPDGLPPGHKPKHQR